MSIQINLLGPVTFANTESGTATSTAAQLFETAAANRVGVRIINTGYLWPIIVQEEGGRVLGYVAPRDHADIPAGQAQAVYLATASLTTTYTAHELIEAPTA